jgi:hypothetical protein
MYCLIPNRRHPSRFVVFKHSSMWKNGTGDEESVSGAPPGIFAITASTLHGAWAAFAVRMSGAAELLSATLHGRSL